MWHLLVFAIVATGASLAEAQIPDSAVDYILGPNDQLSVSVADLTEEFAGKILRIELSGDINLPLIGRVHAAGLTVLEFEIQVQGRLERFVKEPRVVVTIAEYNSQPISVLGAVTNPGVKQVTGSKTLFEVLSLAGGLRPDAGSTINITRRVDRGSLPLLGVRTDETGKFYIGSVGVRGILNATDPEQNIPILSGDVISVSNADVVYALGSVVKPGGFPLNQDESISSLKVVSLAGGLTKTATSKAEILRSVPGSRAPVEIWIDLGQIMAGKAEDVKLQPNDVLYVPNSMVKSASLRALDVLSLAVAYGRFF